MSERGKPTIVDTDDMRYAARVGECLTFCDGFEWQDGVTLRDDVIGVLVNLVEAEEKAMDDAPMNECPLCWNPKDGFHKPSCPFLLATKLLDKFTPIQPQEARDG